MDAEIGCCGDAALMEKKYDRLATEHHESWKRCAYTTPVGQAQKFDAALKIIDFRDVTTMIDAGCGDGAFEEFLLFTHHLLDQGLRTLGLDISQNMVSLCRKKGLQALKANFGSGYCVLIGNADLIVCIGALQCISDHRHALANFRKWLSPGKQLFIVSLDGTIVDPTKKPPGYTAHDKNPEQLVAELTDLGFTIKSIGSIDPTGLKPLHSARDFYIHAVVSDGSK